MKIADATYKKRVAYIPHHANGDRKHPDVELGTVSSTNEKNIFVRFDTAVARHGWAEATGMACAPETLEEA